MHVFFNSLLIDFVILIATIELDDVIILTTCRRHYNLNYSFFSYS